MIQRIQSLYLFIVTALFASLFFTRLITLNGVDFGVSDSVYTIIITAVIALLSLGTIFCFNNRTLQVRVTIFNMLLMLGWYAMAAFLVWKSIDTSAHNDLSFSIVVVFPIISLILDYLAIRGILKDEALVKSYDRLR